MKRLITYFSTPKALSPEIGSTLDRHWSDIAPFHSRKFLTLLAFLLFVGVGQMWAQITVDSNPKTSGTYTITCAKANGSSAPADQGSYIRCYANNTITISTTGANMTGITIAWTKNSSKAFASVTANSGTYSHPSGAGNGTWSGDASSVVFTVGSSGQIQITTVTITTGGGGGTPTCATPTFSPAAGSYIGTQSVTISSTTTGSTIYYTTNGTTPTTSSSHGTEGAASATVSVSSNMTLKAYAVKDGANDSEVATAAYTIVSCAHDNFDWNLATNSYDASPTTDLIKWTGTYATMQNSRGSGTSVTNYIPTSYSSTRFYSGNTLTITPASGVEISHVVFTATTDNYANTLRNSTWTNAAASGSGSYVIVTPTDGTSAFSAAVGGTCGFTNVNVCYSACNTLGSINGSINASGTETTLTVSGWTYAAGATGTTESDVTDYTVRLYKWNSGTSEWDIVSGSTSGGASGAQGTRTGIAKSGEGSKTVTWSGMIYGATYKVTVQPHGTGSYCDGTETAVTTINGTALTSNQISWKYSIYIDEHDNSTFAHQWINSLTSNSGYVDLTLDAFTDWYNFKLVLGGCIWFGNNGTMNSTYHDNWTFSTAEGTNCKLSTAMGGSYRFTVNTGTPTVSVTFPNSDQDPGYKIYYDNSILGWSTLRYRIGNNSNNTNLTPTLVTGTDNFYVVETPDYDGMEAWHFANNCAWSGAHTIYRTATNNDQGQPELAITASTVFQQYKVTEDMTVIPTNSCSRGTDNDGDKVNNQCDFYTINTPTSGMLTHTATIGAHTNGTINIAYTDVSGTAQNKTATTAGLAHRTILTITSTPNTGYHQTALTVDGNAFTSGSTHILSADATIAATYAINNYAVSKGTATGCSGDDFTLSADNVNHGGSITVTASPDASHKGSAIVTISPAGNGSVDGTTISGITGAITVSVSFAAKETATIKTEIAGSESTISGTHYEGDSYTLPSTAADCPDMGLYGWYKGSTYSDPTVAPTGADFYLPGATATLTGGENKFYAVYATIGDPANTYTKITSTGELVTGDYLVVGMYTSSMPYAMENNGTGIEDESVTNATTITTTNANIIWTITKDNSNVTFLSHRSPNKYLAINNAAFALQDDPQNFTFSMNGTTKAWTFTSPSTKQIIYSSNFYVGDAQNKDIYLFKRDQTISGPYTTSPVCTTHELDVVADPVAGGTAEAEKTVLGETKTTTATATPDEHYTFAYWTIEGEDASMSNTVDGKSTDNPVTVTMGTEDATLTAHFTEKEKCTVVFKNNGGIESSTTYWLGENPVAPTLTDGVLNDACDATSDKHYGWTRNLITGNVADQATLDARTGSDVVYTKAATLPAITAGDDGTTITYHAVWAQATGGGYAWSQATSVSVGDEVIIAEIDDGTKELSAFSTTIETSDNYATGSDFTTNPTGTMLWTVEAGNSDGQFSFKSGDYYLNLGTNGNKLNGSDTKSANSSWTISTVSDRAEVTNVAYSTRKLIYKTSNRFACYAKSHGDHEGGDGTDYYYVIFYKRTGGTVYSTFITTCCDKTVALSDGTLSHCTISFSNANPQTCSSTDSERQVTITVTPDAGYEMTSEARLTFTPTDGDPDPTASYVSGPTPVGATYQFVYRFTKDDDGEGTFDATCTAKTYRITLNNNGATTAGTEYVDVVYNTAPATFTPPTKEGYNFQGYWTNTGSPSWGSKLGNNGGTWAPNIAYYTSGGNWIRAENVTLNAKWEEKSLQNYRTECPSFEVYNQDGTSAVDIHLTSTKDVEIYASEAAGNLIRIIASGLDANGNHPKIGVEYYDANNGDALVTGTDRVFRLCSSSTYNTESDLLDLGENTTAYDQTFSISYTPGDYNQSHHYKLKLILRNNNTEKDNVTIHLYGRSLPKEFVIAAKSGDTWYALPNTLAATESAQGAISPTAITVDNATTPTKAVNPIGTVIYGACNKYTNDNRSGLRFTSDGAHWIQTSSTASAYKMWLSNTGYTNAQDWYLKSTDLSAYEVFMDPIGSPSDKRRIELYNSSGVKMGYHNTGATDARTGVGNVYLLPIEFPSMEAGIMEWGTDHVVVELRTPGSSTKVKTQIGGGAIGDEQSLESLRKDEGVYRVAVSLSSSDALKDLKLYFYNSSDVLQGVAEFTIPRIVSSTTTTGAFGTAFKKDAPFVDLVILNGATLTVSETTDGTKFTFRDLYIYGGGKMVVPAGTYIDFSNVYMRGGHLNESWNYVYSHPQLVLNGTMGNTSNTINYDYLTNNSQFYSLALPYEVTLSNIVNPDFNNKQSWLIHAYDGALRASGSQVSGWYDVEEGSTEGDIDPLGSSDALTAGVGYTFFGAPQKVNSIRQKWSVNRFPMTLASGSAEVAKSGVSVTAHGMTESAGVYTLNDGVAPNDAGWNMLGNPFLADIGGTETYETAVKGTILSYHNVKTMDASGNWTGGWHWEENETNVRYVRIPNDLGTEYEQVRFKDATLRAFHHFFIQAGATGTFNFDLATRAQSMPQRIKRGKLLLPEEMDVDFRLSKGEASTKFGLTLCDDFSSDYVMNEDIAEDLSGEAMKAYTLILDQRVTYNGLPFTAAQQIIPVGFRAPNAGEYTFSYQEDENSENIEHIYLTDMRLGVVTDLKDNTYKFASEIGVIDNRFVLQIVFSSNVTTDVEETFEQENGRPLKFLYQGKIYILRNGILYDITGKRVREINK